MLDIDKYGKITFKDDSFFLSQHNNVYKVSEDAITIDVELRDKNILYSILSNTGKVDAVRLNQIPEKLKELGKKNIICDIVDIKFHNFSDESMGLGSAIYFYEKYKIEKILGYIV